MLRKLKNLKKKITHRYRSSTAAEQPDAPEQSEDLLKGKNN
jgi:hypothetical protein